MGNVFGQQVQPITPNPIVSQLGPGMQAAFLNALFNLGGQFDPNNAGGYNYQFTGMPAYPGALSPDLGGTLLPGVYGAYNPNGNPGMDYTRGVLAGINPGESSSYLQALMTQGGYGGPGHQGMTNMVDTGAAGAGGLWARMLAGGGITSETSGKPLQNLANLGISGSAGMPLVGLAQGEMWSPLNQMLAPLLTAQPYKAPAMGGGK